jgi:hypothetical protein
MFLSTCPKVTVNRIGLNVLAPNIMLIKHSVSTLDETIFYFASNKTSTPVLEVKKRKTA